MKKNTTSDFPKKEFSVNEVLSFLEVGLKNINSINREVSNISVKRIKILNGKTLECQFYAESENSIDVKAEISTVMAALHGFFKDDPFKNIRLNYFAIRAYDKSDIEIMYAYSSKEAAAMIGNGKAIDWMKSTIFQENTKDYRLAIAKRQISEIENALRKVIVNRLSSKYGPNWFRLSLSKKLFVNIKGIYENQFGEEIEDGETLIDYAFLLQLKKIICTNWSDFNDLFENKIEFEEKIIELNSIRREEAHNRNITVQHIEILNEIYEFLLLKISEKYAQVLPTYLIDNWKIQLKEIMLNQPALPFKDEDIMNESDQRLKFAKSLLNLEALTVYIKNQESKVQSIVVPIQKKRTHNELISILKEYRILHEEVIEIGKAGNLKLLKEKQSKIEKSKIKMRNFAKRYVYEES